jgi:hypothetical protein
LTIHPKSPSDLKLGDHDLLDASPEELMHPMLSVIPVKMLAIGVGVVRSYFS